jgi:hypothetical protein
MGASPYKTDVIYGGTDVDRFGRLIRTRASTAVADTVARRVTGMTRRRPFVLPSRQEPYGLTCLGFAKCNNAERRHLNGKL